MLYTGLVAPNSNLRDTYPGVDALLPEVVDSLKELLLAFRVELRYYTAILSRGVFEAASGRVDEGCG